MKNLVNFLLQYGIPLFYIPNIGVRELALNKKNVLSFLSICQDEGVAVYGGDTYVILKDGKIRIDSASWSTSENNYINDTKIFLSSLNELPEGEEYIFVVVTSMHQLLNESAIASFS